MKQKKGDDPKGPSPLFLKNSGAVRPGVFSAPTARVFRQSLFRMIRTRRFLSRKAFHRESFLPVKYSDRSSLKEATPLLTFALRDGPTMPDRGRKAGGFIRASERSIRCPSAGTGRASPPRRRSFSRKVPRPRRRSPSGGPCLSTGRILQAGHSVTPVLCQAPVLGTVPG